MRWLLLALLCVVPGCEIPSPEGSTALPVNFTITWQIGVVIVLAYLANSQNHFSGVAKMLLGLLRQLKILPAADDKQALAAEDVAKKLAEVYIQLQGHPEIQAGILQLMHPKSTESKATT